MKQENRHNDESTDNENIINSRNIIDDNDKITSNVILKCTKAFEEKFCHRNGKCVIVESAIEGHNIHAECVCNPGFTGERCMHKLPDYEYHTVIGRQDIAKETLTETSTKTTKKTPKVTIKSSTVRSILNEKEHDVKAPCPTPWNEDFCINGECFMIPRLSTIDYFCNCYDDWFGSRCTEKLIDFNFETHVSSGRRVRRDDTGKVELIF